MLKTVAKNCRTEGCPELTWLLLDQYAPSSVVAKKRMTKREANKLKRAERRKIIKKPWKDLSLRKRAKFLAMYRWDFTLHKYRRRKKKLDVRKQYEKLRQRQKQMRKNRHKMRRRQLRRKEYVYAYAIKPAMLFVEHDFDGYGNLLTKALYSFETETTFPEEIKQLKFLGNVNSISKYRDDTTVFHIERDDADIFIGDYKNLRNLNRILDKPAETETDLVEVNDHLYENIMTLLEG